MYYKCGNELYHHGVKGMHWGVRRYQNEDGSLTTAGLAKQASRRKENGLATRAELGAYAIKKRRYDEGKKLQKSGHTMLGEALRYTAVTALGAGAIHLGKKIATEATNSRQSIFAISLASAGLGVSIGYGQRYAQRMGLLASYRRGDPSLSRKAEAALDRERNRR